MVAFGPAHRDHRGSPDSPWRDAGEGAAPVGRNRSVLASADEPPPSRPCDLRTRGPRRSIADRTRAGRMELWRLRGPSLGRDTSGAPGLEHISGRLPERRIAIGDLRAGGPPDRSTSGDRGRYRVILAWSFRRRFRREMDWTSSDRGAAFLGGPRFDERAGPGSQALGSGRHPLERRGGPGRLGDSPRPDLDACGG
jgi:hypothetical protein